MNAFDKIIGYSYVKTVLQQISDTLKFREIYDNLGVAAPKGLLLYGNPGVGKSLMANAIIEDSGRKAFICRKDQPNGDFVKEIKATFDKAAQNAPSIVYLDDMDKFANGDERLPHAEEYVTVQSCIDEIKGKQVFVLATANNIRCLPRSLRRAGRFDRMLEIDLPHGQDAINIITHYLSRKKIVDDIDVKTIARIMDGRSCAELETVINEAGIQAGFQRAESINMEHFMVSCLRTVFNVPALCNDSKEDLSYSLADFDNESLQIVYHEAGHAVVSEVLCPESVTLIYINKSGGFTDYYDDRTKKRLYWEKSRIIGALGGMAAIEQKFGISDTGCESDLDHAFERTRQLIEYTCVCGFSLHRSGVGDSEQLKAEQEHATATEVEKYYRKAKEIISMNMEFFEKIAIALSDKALLSAADIKDIKSGCNITSVEIS